MNLDAREFDIVLFGATGFVGRLTARHLAAEADPTVRIALAGRSLPRLRDVAADLGPAAEGWPLLVADATDVAAVTDLAGPRPGRRHDGGPVREVRRRRWPPRAPRPAPTTATSPARCCSCTAASRPTTRRAQRTGARIVHACGFDSIPSDLGVWLTAEAARADGAELGRTHLAVRSLKGGFSGGTIDSARTQVDELQDRQGRPARRR